MKFKSFFLASLIFILSIISVNALRCFICNSANDGPCFDPVANNVTIVTCIDISGYPYDYVCFSVLGTSGNVNIATRGCLLRGSADEFCAGVTAIANVECVICDEDLCNA